MALPLNPSQNPSPGMVTGFHQQLQPVPCLQPACGLQGVRSQPTEAANQKHFQQHYQEGSKAKLTPVALLNKPLAVLKGFLPQALLRGKQVTGCG